MYVNLKIKIQGEMLTHDEPIIKKYYCKIQWFMDL